MNRTSDNGGPGNRPPTHGTYWLEDELPFGKLMDIGITQYSEFACSKSTYTWLSAGAMRSVDGVEVRLQVMDESVGGRNVIVHAWPVERSALGVDE